MATTADYNPAMPPIRPAAVAGRFYPDDREQLTAMVQGLLGVAQTSLAAPKALIAPHAGYVYSGPIAANAYARLWGARAIIKRVVLVGPSHHFPLHGLAVCGAEAFASPLGQLPVDKDAIAAVTGLPGVTRCDRAHTLEHSLEVQLPFLQTVLEDFTLVPLVVGDSPPQTVGRVLETLWGGRETLIIVSSDLSHFHDYETAVRVDGATARAIEALRLEDIDYPHACGRDPIRGLLYTARRKDLSAQTIDLRNSADTAGPPHRVVGYGAFSLE